MNDNIFLQTQVGELQRLLACSADDPILGPQVRERLADVQQQLDVAQREPGTFLPKAVPILPRAAIFLRGGGVEGCHGIRPALAGEALIQYEKMYVEQALHDERLAARAAGRQRRPRGSHYPALLFTGTPRGSFGLEFVPQLHEDDSLLEVHSQSLVNIADALVQVAESDEDSLDQAVNKIPPRVVQPLKQFLKTLAQYGAELRLAFPNRPSQVLAAEKLKAATDILEREVEQTTLTIKGVLRGVTLDTGFFDFRSSTGDFISGNVADQLTEDDLERLEALTNKECVAEFEQTIVRKLGGPPAIHHVLIRAD